MGIITELTEQGARELGLTLPDGAGAAFETYYNTLYARGREMNLTAIDGERETAQLHFLDSLALLTTGDFRGARVIDVGSGAGFPGLPLRLCVPSIELTLLDATRKRVDFLSELCGLLGLSGVTCLHARAEEAARLPEHRDGYDFALSRAVARLNVLSELCLPFVRPGGVFIAMKGTESGEETAEAGSALAALGAELERTADYTIPGTDITHRAVIIRKASTTPDGYPRRFARIQKSPL